MIESRRTARRNRKLQRQAQRSLAQTEQAPVQPAARQSTAPPKPSGAAASPVPRPLTPKCASRRRKRHKLGKPVFGKETDIAPPPPQVHGLAKLITNLSTAYWLLSVANANGSTAEMLHTRARERGSGWVPEKALRQTLRELCKGKFLRRDRTLNAEYYVLLEEGEILLEEMWDLRYTVGSRQ